MFGFFCLQNKSFGELRWVKKDFCCGRNHFRSLVRFLSLRKVANHQVFVDERISALKRSTNLFKLFLNSLFHSRLQFWSKCFVFTVLSELTQQQKRSDKQEVCQSKGTCKGTLMKSDLVRLYVTVKTNFHSALHPFLSSRRWRSWTSAPSGTPGRESTPDSQRLVRAFLRVKLSPPLVDNLLLPPQTHG